MSPFLNRSTKMDWLRFDSQAHLSGIPRKITGKADSLGRASHGLRERFDGGLAKFEKFFTVVGLHLAFGVFLHGEFNVDAVSVNTPREVHFFAQEALTAGEDVDHGVLGHSADVPCAGRVGGGVSMTKNSSAVRVEGVASAVRLYHRHSVLLGWISQGQSTIFFREVSGLACASPGPASVNEVGPTLRMWDIISTRRRGWNSTGFGSHEGKPLKGPPRGG